MEIHPTIPINSKQYLPIATKKQGLPWWLSSKESACNAGDAGSIPGSGRSPGGGHGNLSSILAKKIPWTEENGRLQFHNWSEWALRHWKTNTYSSIYFARNRESWGEENSLCPQGALRLQRRGLATSPRYIEGQGWSPCDDLYLAIQPGKKQ